MFGALLPPQDLTLPSVRPSSKNTDCHLNFDTGDLCGTSTQPKANAQAALKQWKAAGFPASKLLLGLPLYGYVSQSSKKVLTGSSIPSPDMLLLQTETVAAAPFYENENGSNNKSKVLHFVNGAHARPKERPEVYITANLQSYWGQQIAFKDLVASGALAKQADGSYWGGGGFSKGLLLFVVQRCLIQAYTAWDNCSNTPVRLSPLNGLQSTHRRRSSSTEHPRKLL